MLGFWLRPLHSRALFALALPAMALLCSSCLIGEKEPGVVTASLTSASSNGCLDDLEQNAVSVWEGELSESSIRKTADCTRSAIQSLIRQVEGSDESQFLNPAEFRAFLNGMLFRSSPLTQVQADRLLKFKSYLLGGSEQSWADSDSRNLLPLITLIEEELIYWVPLIQQFRDSPEPRAWERLKARAHESADRLEGSLLASSGEATLTVKDVGGMLEDVLLRLEEEGGFKRPDWLESIDSASKLLLRAKFLLAGGSMGRLEPESRARLAALAVRLAPYAIGKSLEEETPLKRLRRLWNQRFWKDVNDANDAFFGAQLRERSLTDFLLADGVAELPKWIALDGEALPLPTLIQWLRELPPALAPDSLADSLPKIERWTAWIKPLTIGGPGDTFSRRDLKRAATLAGQILPALQSAAAPLDPGPLLEAFLHGWELILASDPEASKQTVPEARIVSLLEKVSREEWERQPAPGTLAGAVRLARYSLEGPTDGTLGDAMKWERWLEMLKVAAVIQGPVLDAERTPESNIDLLQSVLAKVVEGSHCATRADQPCIPLKEVHAFFLKDRMGPGNRELTLSETGAVKQLLLGGSPEFISWQDLLGVRDALGRLRPALLEGLRGDFDAKWFARNLRKLWSETSLRHPNGIPAPALRLILASALTAAELREPPAGTPLSELIFLTLTGTTLPKDGKFPAAAWSTLGDTLAGWNEAWFVGPERESDSCRKLSPKDRVLNRPSCWGSLRKRLTQLPVTFPGKRLPWTLIDQWLQVGASNGWLPEDATAEEFSLLIRAVASGFARTSIEQRSRGISQKALSRMLETVAEMLPVLASTRELAREPRLQDPKFWLEVESEIRNWQNALGRLTPLFPAGTGIPLWAYAEILNALPMNWLTLDRKLVLASSGPFFQRIWTCASGEALCPSGLVRLLDQFTPNVRMEHLANRFAQILPDSEAPVREEWIARATAFGDALDRPSERELWARWIETAREYPDYFKTPTGQALFVPSNRIHALNVRTFFHLSTAADFVHAAYSETASPLPLTFDAFTRIADDFDDLAKAFKIIENRTPELAPTRFREANLFSPHGNGDDWLDRREMTGYLALIWSGKTFTNRVTDRTTPPCALPDGRLDSLGRPILDMPCFRSHLTRTLRAELLDHQPGLLDDWSRWSEAEERQFIEAMELAGREKAHGDEPISINDIDGITGLLQYLEVLTFRFDRDLDGALSEIEVHEMFPVVRATIAAAVADEGSESLATNEDLLESLFTWVLTRKTLPKGPLPVKFLQWHQARKVRKFQIRRLDAMVAIAVLIGPPIQTK